MNKGREDHFDHLAARQSSAAGRRSARADPLAENISVRLMHEADAEAEASPGGITLEDSSDANADAHSDADANANADADAEHDTGAAWSNGSNDAEAPAVPELAGSQFAVPDAAIADAGDLVKAGAPGAATPLSPARTERQLSGQSGPQHDGEPAPVPIGEPAAAAEHAPHPPALQAAAVARPHSMLSAESRTTASAEDLPIQRRPASPPPVAAPAGWSHEPPPLQSRASESDRQSRQIMHRIGMPAQLSSIQVTLSVQIGSSALPLRDLLAVEPGQLVPLDKLTSDPVDIFVNGRIFARGEVVAIGNRFGVRLLELVEASDAG